jgi:enterochelin esterase-like enzyme
MRYLFLMKKLIYISFIFLVLSLRVKSQEPLPKVMSGTIERIENFHSQYVTSRNTDVWLPDGYSDSIKYPVLYMNDGQMLFDPDLSWNKQAWNIADIASELFKGNITRKFIVVGIWNDGQTRHPDYFPQKPFEMLSAEGKDTITAQLKRARLVKEAFSPQSDNYLKFIVNELMPYIDTKYSVSTGPDDTYIAGSSMGGLISLYAICEYPGVFGGAACMSTHWPGTFMLQNNPFPDAIIEYLSRNLPDPCGHKIYFDCGDKTLDALYPEIQKRVDSLMVSKGYNENHWITKYFPGEDHSEKAWGKRVAVPLAFLFRK